MTTKPSGNAQVAKEAKKQSRNPATLHKMTFIPAADIAQQIQKTPAIPEKTNTAPLAAKIIAAKSDQTASVILNPMNRPDQTASATLNPTNRPILSTIAQNQIKSKTVLTAIDNKSLTVTNAQPEKNKNTEKMRASSKAPVNSKKPVITAKAQDSETTKTPETAKIDIGPKAILQKNTKETAPQISVSESKIAIKTEKTAIKDEPTIPLDTKTTVSIPETVTNNYKTTNNGEQSAITDKPTIAINEKQSSPSSQKVSITQEAQTLAAEITTPDKTDAGRKDPPRETKFSGLPEKDEANIENLSNKFITQKTSQPRIQLSARQAEIRGNLPLLNNTSNTNMELSGQVHIGENAQPAITEESPTSPSAFATLAKATGNADSGINVSEQIKEAIHTSLRPDSQQIVIRLNPPELGKIAIKFAEQGDDITGLLQVDKPQTRDQIQQMLPEIIQNLQNSGIGIKKLEVVLTNSNEQYTSKEQSSTTGQDNFSEQQSSPNPESQQNNTTYNQWLRNTDNITEFDEPQTNLINSSINMLV